MKQHFFIRIGSNGLLLLTFLLLQTTVRAQESTGSAAAQAIENAANKLTSPNAEFHEAVQKVVETAKQAAAQQQGTAETVNKAARDKLDQEIRKAAGKPWQQELESLRKRWIDRELISVSAADQEAAAQEAYENGYIGKTPEARADAFNKAAELFDKAAETYRKEGNTAKTESMEGWARAARSNAKTHGPQPNADGKQYYFVQSTPSSLDGLSLDNANAKIIPATTVPRFSIAATGAIPFGKPTPKQVNMNDLQASVFTPEVMEQLFEKLGGEFFIGEISGPGTQPLEMRGTLQPMPGLQFGVRLGQRFELRAGAQRFRSAWSGNFPVVVFPQDADPPAAPQTVQGSLHASATGVQGDIDLAYFFTTGKLQPFVSAGARGQFPTEINSGAEIAGVPIPVEIASIDMRFSPVLGAGCRFGIFDNGFAALSCTYGRMPGSGYVPAVHAGLGWRF